GQPWLGRAVPRPVRPAAGRAGRRRLVGCQEDAPRVGGDVQDRRRDVRDPAGGDHRPHRRPDGLSGPHARPDRGGAVVIRTIGRTILGVVVLTLIFGIAYPVVMTGIAQVAFSDTANGSLIRVNGTTVGSKLAAQGFTGAGYF